MKPVIPLPHIIFLIDDDKDDCNLFEAALMEINPSIECTSVNNCMDILQQLDKVIPELIFLDIRMPSKNGFDCIKEIREIKHLRYIPVVMYSGVECANDINVSYGLGATLYFRKPSSFTEIVTSLKAILEIDWRDPDAIPSLYFKEGNYYSFNPL